MEQSVAIRVPSQSRGNFAVHHAINVAIADEVVALSFCCRPQYTWPLGCVEDGHRVTDSCKCWAKANKSGTRAKHSSHVGN
jgi:hypothetical protein